MKKIVLFLFLLSLSRASFAEVQTQTCSVVFKKSSICGDIVWTIPPKKNAMPTAEDQAEFVLTLTEKKVAEAPTQLKKKTSSQPLTLDSVDGIYVKLFMPSMDHGTLPTESTLITEGENSSSKKFKVREVFFSMSGPWEIRIDLRKGKKTLDSAVIPYTL